jgi:hypothetical protein
MEEMGMTDSQWKDNLRNQQEDWEEVKELLPQNPDTQKALDKINKVLNRIQKSLED